MVAGSVNGGGLVAGCWVMGDWPPGWYLVATSCPVTRGYVVITFFFGKVVQYNSCTLQIY